MQEQMIKCPRCGNQILMGEAVTHQIEEKVRLQVEQKTNDQAKEFQNRLQEAEKKHQQQILEERNRARTEAKKEATEIVTLEMNHLQARLKEKTSQVEDAKKRELELLNREQRLQEKENDLELKMQRTLNQERKKIEAEVSQRVESQVKASVAIELESLKADVQRKEEALESSRKRELNLLNREQQLESKEKTLEVKLQQTLNQERKKIAAEVSERVEKQVKESVSIEMEILRLDVERKSKELEEAQRKEVTLLQNQRELEERQKALDLEVERKITSEMQKIWDQATAKVAEEHHLKDLEKDRKMAEMCKQIENLKRKAEQGSQPLQGDVMQFELEEILASTFRFDEVQLIKRGAKGADVLQTMRDASQRPCGSILWESKNAKDWSDDWIQKLKSDQRQAKADIGVIVSKVLPDGAPPISYREGVWITELCNTVWLATALRVCLMHVSQARAALVGKTGKMESLYNYHSTEFKTRVESVAEPLIQMKSDHETEKRSTIRRWARWEKQMEKAMENLAGMYGDVEGILGSLPEIKALQLPEPPSALPTKEENDPQTIVEQYTVNESGKEYSDASLPFAEESYDDDSDELYEDDRVPVGDDDDVPF